MGIVRIKGVYLRISSIAGCTYTILLETVQLVVRTQSCFLSTIMGTIRYVHYQYLEFWGKLFWSLLYPAGPPQIVHLISYPGANTNYPGPIQLSLGAQLRKVPIRLNSYEKILRDRSNWFKIAYMELNEEDYGGLSLKEKQDKLKEDRDQVRAWKKEVGWQMMARNRLYELFIKVSPRFSCANPKALSFF